MRQAVLLGLLLIACAPVSSNGKASTNVMANPSYETITVREMTPACGALIEGVDAILDT